MKNTKNTAFLFLLFSFMLAACGGDATSVPTDTPIPSPTPDSSVNTDPGPASLDLSDPNSMMEIPGDYELTMDFAFSGMLADGSLVEGAILLEGQQLTNAAASSMAISASGAADLGGVDFLEIVEIDDRSYIFNEINGCISLPANTEEDSLFNNMVDTGGLLTGILQREGPNESINGVSTYHFAITGENLDSSDFESMDVTAINEGSLYIAIDGGYVVRLIIRGEGTSDLLTGRDGLIGEIDYQLDFIPAAGLQIVPPDGCEESSDPDSDYPLLPDASNVAAFGAIYSYQSNTSIEAAIDFYKVQLIADGWTLEQEIAAGNTAILLFTLGDRKLSVAMNIDPDNPGSLSIVLAEE